MSETNREIAERLAQNFNHAFRGSYVPSAYRGATTAIEVALNAERERALIAALPVETDAGNYVHRNDPPLGLAGVYCKAPANPHSVNHAIRGSKQ